MKIKLELGMRFAFRAELKSCLSNYKVAHGYDLCYEKNNKDRFLLKCCKGKIPQCPFRVCTSYMKDEQTFQIKFLREYHSYSRAFKLGSIVTYKWIGKQYFTDILESPTMSLRKMKAMVSKLFNINVTSQKFNII